MKLSIILGAGFSYVAGLPLTSSIFDTDEVPPVSSAKDRTNMEHVRAAFAAWKRANPHRNSEEWLAELHRDRNNELSNMLHGTRWEHAVQFALRRLAKVKNARPGAYYYGISRYDPDDVAEAHRDFWGFVRTFDCRTVVTLNYDLLVERALHIVDEDGFARPDFAYGGLPYRQVVRKMTNVTTGAFEDVFLGSDGYLIYKLHGSLNWAFERHSPNMKLHDDVRAAFRRTEEVGVPAVVPPIPEKDLPEKMSHVWNQAREALSESDAWLVCGYSMPEYDEALRTWFGRILANSTVRKIAVLDPNSDQLLSRWRHSDRADLQVEGFAGLPEGLKQDLREFLTAR